MNRVRSEIHPPPILINCSIKINRNIKLINIILSPSWASHWLPHTLLWLPTKFYVQHPPRCHYPNNTTWLAQIINFASICQPKQLIQGAIKASDFHLSAHTGENFQEKICKNSLHSQTSIHITNLPAENILISCPSAIFSHSPVHAPSSWTQFLDSQ